MNTTIRRYETIDQSRKSELVKKVDETLVPQLSELPGFSGYYLLLAFSIEASLSAHVS